MATRHVVTAVSFGWAMSWILANIGLRVKDPETAQTAGFVWLFPLSFVSSVFTPVATMPGWLQPIARNNPVTLVANLLRGLAVGHVEAAMVWPVLAWIVGITAVFAPMAVRRYRTSVPTCGRVPLPPASGRDRPRPGECREIRDQGGFDQDCM
ncbi:MAG: ABC transporter permease [Microthrixaceae bacterium]